MPSSIVPINLTRSHSLRGAPEGLRYGNFEGVIHLPPLKTQANPGLQNYSKFNNQQIYKTVCEWFESWRPWQQKTVLYGIVDRCSTRQLDMLATTLEPVRHRDYAAAYKMRYPSSPFRNSRSRSMIRENKTPEKAASIYDNDASSEYTVVASLCNGRAERESPQKQLTSTISSAYKVDQSEPADSVVSSGQNSMKDHTMTAKMGVVQEKVVFSERTAMSPVHKFADVLATNIMQSALDEVSILEKFINRENSIPPAQSEMSKEDTFVQSLAVRQPLKSEKSFLPPIVDNQELQRFSPLPRPKTDDLQIFKRSEIQMSKPGTGLTRSLSEISRQSVTRLRYEFYGAPTSVSTSDFFPRQGILREGSMQREVRFSQVGRPRHLRNIPISLQRSFKGIKWWTEEPQAGRIFLKAKKKELVAHFKEQLQQIWTWLGMWEDYEKIILLKEILKISGSEVLSALFHHIQQKLRDTRDINRLSDKLLLYIFSLMVPEDIAMSSQVCKRWRFLCATDSLWMIKCHELGLKEGISNMEDLVLKANTRKMGIDWRLAYDELNRLTYMMKLEAKQKEIDAYEEAERLRKLKAEQEDDTIFEVESEKALKFQLNSEDILIQYQRMFHYDAYTPSSSSEVDIEVKRGTQSVIDKEEAEKKAQEEARKREKYAIKMKKQREEEERRRQEEQELSDEGSIISSEDLSMYQDFVYQARDNEEEDEEGQEKNDSVMQWKPIKSSGREEKPKELERIQKDNELELKQLVKREKKRFKSKRQKTDVSFVRSMVKQKPQPKKAKDEVALDVRTDLVQAEDILGKSVPSLQLEWRKDDAEEDNEYKLSVQKYMGVVKSVRRVRKLQGHMNGVMCVFYDKKRLISAGLDRCIRLWDIRSGQSIHKFYGHKGGIRCLQFEGNTLVSGSWDTTIIVWDLKTFEKRTILSDHRGCVSCLQLNHKYMLSGSHDKTVRVWHRLTFSHHKVLEPGHQSGINCLYYDGTHVVTGSSDMTLRLTDLETEQCLHVFENGQDQVLSVVMQGDLIISSDTKGHVYFWNSQNGESEAAIQAHEAPVNKLAFFKGRFFTASTDCTVREWDLLTMTSVRLLQGHKGPVRDVKISSDRIVTCSDDGTIRIWDLSDTKRTLRHK